MSYEILTDEQYEEAERIALRSIGRGWAMALPKKERFLDATREEILRAVVSLPPVSPVAPNVRRPRRDVCRATE